MEPTGWRKEPRYTIVMSAIGVGAAAWLCTITGAPAWIAVLAGFALGHAAGTTISAWRNAKMIGEVTAQVARDAAEIMQRDLERQSRGHNGG